MVKRGNIIKMISWKDAEGFEFHLEPIEDSLTVKKVKDGFEARYLAYDEMAESPDEDGDDAVFLVNYHSDFNVRKDTIIMEADVRNWYRGTEKLAQEKEIFYLWVVLSYS